MPNCNMGLLWERFCLLYDLYSDSLRCSRRKGKRKGIGRKGKKRACRAGYLPTITELHRKLGQNSFPKTVSQYYAILNNTATISSAASKWMDANLGKKRHASFPRHLAGRLIVRKDALELKRCKLKLKLACWGRDGTRRLKEIVSSLKFFQTF